MKIVIIDGRTANPGDLSWAEFKALGELQVYDRTSELELVERAADAEAILTNKAIVSAAAMARLPRLRYIGVTATGYNNVDIAAARARGIPVCNVPEYGTRTVAQATFALLLELTNQTGHHAQSVREGRWCASKDFCYWDGSLLELAGLTLGIVGHGRIGQTVGQIGQAFGMNVATLQRSGREVSGALEAPAFWRTCDVVSLHCPLTPETRELVNAETLRWMKPTALLLNTARGALIRENDLAEALDQERLAGAGLDVLSIEPPSPSHPLLRAKNCLITPHIAWATRAARQRLLQSTAENLRAFLQGTPRHVVNGV